MGAGIESTEGDRERTTPRKFKEDSTRGEAGRHPKTEVVNLNCIFKYYTNTSNTSLYSVRMYILYNEYIYNYICK